MALSKIISSSIATDAVGPTQLNEAANYDFTGTVTGAGGDNKPYFFTIKSSNQSVNDNVSAKITFPASSFHSASNVFDNTNSKFTVATAGVYQFNAKADLSQNDRFWSVELMLYKNGSEISSHKFYDRQDDNQDLFSKISLNVSTLDNASVNDYYEVYAYGNTESGDAWSINGGSTHKTTFSAYKLIT